MTSYTAFQTEISCIALEISANQSDKLCLQVNTNLTGVSTVLLESIVAAHYNNQQTGLWENGCETRSQMKVGENYEIPG